MIDTLSKSDEVVINNYGIISHIESATSARIEDVLRAVLVKQAKISHIKDFLLKILHLIPNELISNTKCRALKSRGGASKRNKKTNNSSKWIIYKHLVRN